MPSQIKLATATTATPIAPTGTTLIGTQNSLLIADEHNHAEARSEFHAGPNQPLGKVKMWFDTTNNRMKLNNGKEWVDAAHEAPKANDFGSWEPEPVTRWVDITDVAFYDLSDNNTCGSYDGNIWTSDGSEIWLYPIGSYINNMTDPTAEEYAIMAHWSKGLRFSKIRITFTGEVNSLYIANCNGSAIVEVEGNITSGYEYPCVWPVEEGIGFWSDLGFIDLWNIIDTISKIEIYTDQAVVKPI